MGGRRCSEVGSWQAFSMRQKHYGYMVGGEGCGQQKVWPMGEV